MYRKLQDRTVLLFTPGVDKSRVSINYVGPVHCFQNRARNPARNIAFEGFSPFLSRMIGPAMLGTTFDLVVTGGGLR